MVLQRPLFVLFKGLVDGPFETAPQTSSCSTLPEAQETTKTLPTPRALDFLSNSGDECACTRTTPDLALSYSNSPNRQPSRKLEGARFITLHKNLRRRR